MDWYQIVWMICIMLPFTYYGISLSKPTKGKMIFGVNISHELTKAPVIKRVRKKSYNLNVFAWTTVYGHYMAGIYDLVRKVYNVACPNACSVCDTALCDILLWAYTVYGF